MHHLISIIYVSTTSASVATSFPQLRQLWIMKDSSEFNLFTWIAWLVAQLTALVYAVSISSVPYFIVNILWVSFYVAMIGLILKYRRRPSAVLMEADENLG